ncbi:SNF2 family N-terminal domain-containing protein [Gymnopilus junonius]|uniref:SNF2 family N-terminal domain-containing protein n=1 Tax=Gymnopilus junonius TaxID=109634 RepID=A0A9P5N789_GYMJU|nr:SNF2 family N-terminal domain-containing protein [Gymnopilus junonius]
MEGVLSSLNESLSSSKIIDVGVKFREDDGHIVCICPSLQYPFANKNPLFRVPSLTVDAATNDLSPQSADLLMAIRSLQSAGRAYLEATLKIIIRPPPDKPETLPLSLQLELKVSLVFPTILEPIPTKRATKKSVQAVEDAQRRLLHAVYLPDDVISTTIRNPVTVSAFYSIMRPAPPLPSQMAIEAMQPADMLATLLPFQRRSVGWLLEREGMTVTPQGEIVPQSSSHQFSFWENVGEGNRSRYFNRLSGELIDSEPEIPIIYGAMLAEEPGLGKTVETIALIQLNSAPSDWNPSLSDGTRLLDWMSRLSSTLIVTPPALASQWKSELTRHAPTLKVLFYDGWAKVKVPITKTDRELERFAKLELNARPKKKSKGKGKKTAGDDMDVDEDGMLSRSEDGDILDWCNYVHQFDVVITTYPVLRTEIHVARPAPERPRREDALYSRTPRSRSPLVMVEWKRVVMDEVQMVGGGAAAEMVSLIPRLSSLAVSGTPAKSQMSDLIHVLKFLRIDQLVGNLRLWSRLLKPGYVEEFSSFLRHYGIRQIFFITVYWLCCLCYTFLQRTMKSSVTSELTIPQQTRYLVGIDLGKVERHVYDQALEEVLLQLGLDARGVAATSGWQPHSNVLRAAIRRLRVSAHTLRRGDGLYKPGALKTIEAVLDSMREQNWKNVMEDWKTKIQLLIRQAQLQQKDELTLNHQQNALRTLEMAETETNNHIEELNGGEEEIAPGDKGKGKARERVDEDEGSEVDPEEFGLPKTPAGDEHRTKRRAIKQRLRDGYLLLHRVVFLKGDVYHVLQKSDKEDAAYHAADKLRRELLKVPEDEATKAMAVLKAHAPKKGLSLEDLIVDVPLLDQGGIRSADLMDEANSLIEHVFNEQSALLWKWRTHIMRLLMKPLNHEEADQAEGDEYQRSLDDQGEVETYMQAYAALLADRREALVNERTLLAAHDVREKQLRHTKAAMKAAATMSADGELDIPEDIEILPEHEVLHKELSNQRKNILLALQGRAVKSILIDLNAVSVKILQDNHPEKAIVRRQLTNCVALFLDKLDADLALIRKAFNQRILYFRQLQEISDSVTDVEWEEPSVMLAIQTCVMDKATLDAKMNTTRARQRYLDNLTQNQDGEVGEEDKTCILCRSEFSRGFITQCAHVFCEICMKAWLVRKEGRTCPVCRVQIDPASIQRFTVNATEVEAPAKLIAGELAPQSTRKISYNNINPTLFAEIQTMETYGDFGSKIQTLVRHLAYLNFKDPGAKSIIFSAWADSLHIVERALTDNGIRSLRIDQGSKSATEKFASDPNILVLLLHGERENAGLNVTCASRVFLLESVVQHSFEYKVKWKLSLSSSEPYPYLLAIARIDRLGQTRPTEVFCYYAEDTIERNILDLAARKGLSLYTRGNSSGTVSVSPFVQDNEQGVDDPEKRKTVQRGDFIHKVDDMLSILFPHMFEDLEYLLPPSIIDLTADRVDLDVDMPELDPGYRMPLVVEDNAAAGPSRLPWM